MEPLYEGTFYTDLTPGVKPIGMPLPDDFKSSNPAGRRSFFYDEATYNGRAPRANYGNNIMRFGYAAMSVPDSYLSVRD
jgi:hypothetical protein